MVKENEANSKSIEQLENDYWKDLDGFPTGLVERCFKFRKIPVKDLAIEHLRTLISQKIGLKYLIPSALKILEEDILVEGDLYKGCLLDSVIQLPTEFWDDHPEEYQTLKKTVESQIERIKVEFGDRELERVTARLK